jgi:hypothetical protein
MPTQLKHIAQSALSVFGIRTEEETPFQVVDRIGRVEVRRYDRRAAVETTVEAEDHSKARSAAFGILADYIFGKNHDRRRIAMTAPVATGDGREMAMTTPVETYSAGPDMLTMRFFLPAEITPANAPLPDDQRVRLVEVSEETLAVLGFSGTWTDEHLLNKREELTRSVGTSTWHAEGRPFWLFYDPPFAIPFLRRNEVAVRVSRKH